MAFGLSLLSVFSGYAESGVTLAKDGSSSHVIVVPENAIPAEKTAAEQFKKYFAEITGADLKIVPEKGVAAGTPQILIGAGKRAKELMPDQRWKELGHDGIVIKTVGEDLILAGGQPRGTLYAVFRFLQDTVGCQWWTPTERLIPKQATLRIPEQNTVYRPPFDYRSQQTTATIDDPVFATIMGENGTVQKQTKEWGGHNKIFGSVHTMLYLVPPEKHFKRHPEWYTDATNGDKPCTSTSPTPTLYNSQLCWTNPDVAEVMAENALEWISRDPECGYISISQSDNDNYCTCEKCEEMVKREGSRSAPLLYLVNQVAAKVKEKYPDFIVETLTYRGTINPPKDIKPADNVMIRLAPLKLDFSRPYDDERNSSADPESTEHIRELLPAWAKLARQMFIWNYTTNYRYTMLPHPNWDGLAKDLRFFVANNVKGVFQEGDKYTNGVGDFVQLRTWLLAQLLWDPTKDQSSLTDEFLSGYYGDAAPFLRKYLDLTVEKFQAYTESRLSVYNVDFMFMDLDTMNESMKLMASAAEAVKSDPVLSERVRLQRVPLDLLWLYRYREYKQRATAEGKPFLGPKDPVGALAELDATARHFKIKQFHQQHSDDIGLWSEELARLETMVAPRKPLPKEILSKVRGGREEIDVLDVAPPEIRINREKVFTDRVDDPESSTGRAISVAGENGARLVSYQFGYHGDNFFKDDEWRLFVVARVKLVPDKPLTGDAFELAIYDHPLFKKTGKGDLFKAKVPLETLADGKYHVLDLGTGKMKASSHFWLAASGNPAVKTIYIDRIVLVREKSETK